MISMPSSPRASGASLYPEYARGCAVARVTVCGSEASSDGDRRADELTCFLKQLLSRRRGLSLSASGLLHHRTLEPPRRLLYMSSSHFGARWKLEFVTREGGSRATTTSNMTNPQGIQIRLAGRYARVSPVLHVPFRIQSRAHDRTSLQGVSAPESAQSPSSNGRATPPH